MTDEKNVVDLRVRRLEKHFEEGCVDASAEDVRNIVQQIDSLDEMHKRAEAEQWSEEKRDAVLREMGYVRYDPLDLIDTEEGLYCYLKHSIGDHAYHPGMFRQTIDTVVRFHAKYLKDKT